MIIRKILIDGLLKANYSLNQDRTKFLFEHFTYLNNITNALNEVENATDKENFSFFGTSPLTLDGQYTNYSSTVSSELSLNDSVFDIDVMNDTLLDLAASLNLTSTSVPIKAGFNWLILLLILLVFTGGFGNTLVCLAILFERRLQNATNYFLLR